MDRSKTKGSTRVICFFGGPGVGKTTLATGLFSLMKKLDYSVEYVSEYAKEVTWEGTNKLLENQLHVFAEQFRRQWRLKDKVDYIITDSPLLLSIIYIDVYNEKHKQFPSTYIDATKDYIYETNNLFDNINLFVNRKKLYKTEGRNETKEEAERIDGLILDLLDPPFGGPLLQISHDLTCQELLNKIHSR